MHILLYSAGAATRPARPVTNRDEAGRSRGEHQKHTRKQPCSHHRAGQETFHQPPGGRVCALSDPPRSPQYHYHVLTSFTCCPSCTGVWRVRTPWADRAQQGQMRPLASPPWRQTPRHSAVAITVIPGTRAPPLARTDIPAVAGQGQAPPSPKLPPENAVATKQRCSRDLPERGPLC